LLEVPVKVRGQDRCGEDIEFADDTQNDRPPAEGSTVTSI
jgi:hypothetical protein